jgi:hypothetical protein
MGGGVDKKNFEDQMLLSQDIIKEFFFTLVHFCWSTLYIHLSLDQLSYLVIFLYIVLFS